MRAAMMALSVAVLLMLGGSVALAAPPAPKEKQERVASASRTKQGAAKHQAAAGVVVSKGDSSFVVRSKRGDVDVRVDGETRYSVKGNRAASLADVPVGGRVNVRGTRDGDTLAARMVHLIAGRPSFRNGVGEITEYRAASGGASGGITVKNRFNVLYSFVVTDQTKIVLPEGRAQPRTGDRVTVVGTRADQATTTPAARSVVVHKNKQQ